MSKPRPYDEDLAYIHDVGFGGFAMQAAPELIEILHGAGIEVGLVVDLGCGSGIWARELAAAGYQTLGVDISAAMLRIARQRVPQARFRRGSFLDVELPSCAAVTAIGEVFNYQFDAANGHEALARFFNRIHAALEPGGMLIFDVAGPGRSGGPGRRQKNCHGDDWALLLETEEDATSLVRRITTFRRVGKLYRRADEVHRVHLYRPAEIARSLRRAGFRVQTLRGYGQLRFPRGLAGFAARKS